MSKAPKHIARGSNVAFTLGGSTVTGTVIDDHGPIGPGGVRLLRVRVLDDLIEPFEADVREDHLRVVYAATG